MAEQQDELNKLRYRIAELEEENDILKKLLPSSREIKNRNRGMLPFHGSAGQIRQNEVGQSIGRINKFVTYEELEAAVMEYIDYYNRHRYKKQL